MKTKTKEQLDAAKEELELLRSEIVELDAKDELTDDESVRLDEAVPEFETKRSEYDADLARAEQMNEISRAAFDGFTGDGDGSRVTPVPGASTRSLHDFDEIRRSSDSPEAYAGEMVSRAAEIIEKTSRAIGDDAAEQATRLLERGVDGDPDGTAVADFWVRYGSPEYKETWTRALKGDTSAQNDCRNTMPATQRAAWAEGGTTTGGFAVPADYDLTLRLITTGAQNPFRQISDVVQTNSNVWKGLTTAGVTAEWMTESTEMSDATPAIAQPSITVYKADAYLTGSFEVVADSNLGNEIVRLVADAKNKLEATAFAVGTGGGQPYGVITRIASGARVAGSSGAAGAADLVAADVFAVDNALDPQWRQNASWVANKVIYNKIRQLANVGSGTAPGAFWTDFGGGVPAQLIGYPTYQASAMDGTIVSGSNDDILLLGDFKAGYVIVDRLGSTMVYNPLVLGSNRRPTGEVGWVTYWRTGADVVDATNTAHFRLLRI